MAKVLCVLYDDPVDGYPPAYARDDVPQIERYHDGQTTPSPQRPRLHARRAARQRVRRARPAQFLEGLGHTLVVTSDKDGPDSRLRARAARRRGRHLPAVLARLPDGRADRQGAEAEARADRRHRLRPRRPAGRDRRRADGRRGDLLQQHQRRRARRDDDPRARAQLHPLVPGRRRRRLEHRRLRLALLRPRGHAGRHGRRRAHRLGRAAPAEAVRGRPALHRPPPPARRRSSASSASPSTRTPSRWSASATSSRSTRRCTPRPRTCSTSACSRR